MPETHTMIFVDSHTWWRSPNCSLELSRFRTENVARARNGRRPLKGILLQFPDFPGGLPGGMTQIPVERRYAVTDEAARLFLTRKMRGFRVIDEQPLERLLNEIN